MHGFQVPVILYLNSQQKRWLYEWAIALRFDVEETRGSGRIVLSQYRKWLKACGWKNPSRMAGDLLRSPFAHIWENGEAVSLRSRKFVIEYLVTNTPGFTSGRDAVNVFTAFLDVADGLTLPAFKQWLLRHIAAYPQYRPTRPKSRPGRSAPAQGPLGRSVETIARQSGYSGRSVIKHTRDIRIVNWETFPIPTDRDEAAMAKLNAYRKNPHYIIKNGRIYIRLANSYKAPSRFARRILLKISCGGHARVKRVMKAKFGRHWEIETGKKKIRFHFPSPY